jgi:DNA-binding LacI/PurR family transcriptional regulator
VPARQTLTDRFASRLRQEIKAGRYTTERPIPSERQLARKYGISRVTARRSLRQLCEERLLEAKPARGYFVVAGAADADLAGEARAVLFVQRGVEGRPTLDTTHTGIVNGALAEAESGGVDLYIVCRQFPDFKRTFRRQWGSNLRGVLLDWYRPDLAAEMIQEEVPVILVEIDMEGLPITSVIQDNAGGVRQALEHFEERGHKRLGMIVAEQETIHPNQRRGAYREFLLRRGIPSSGGWLAQERLNDDGGRRATAALLDCAQPPTAILVCHREMISGVVGELHRRGLEYPRDVSLMVWGEPQPGEAGGEVTDLSYVHWSKEEMGRLAMRALEERIKVGRTERMVMRIGTRLVDLGSVGAAAR